MNGCLSRLSLRSNGWLVLNNLYGVAYGLPCFTWFLPNMGMSKLWWFNFAYFFLQILVQAKICRFPKHIDVVWADQLFPIEPIVTEGYPALPRGLCISWPRSFVREKVESKFKKWGKGEDVGNCLKRPERRGDYSSDDVLTDDLWKSTAECIRLPASRYTKCRLYLHLDR